MRVESSGKAAGPDSPARGPTRPSGPRSAGRPARRRACQGDGTWTSGRSIAAFGLITTSKRRPGSPETAEAENARSPGRSSPPRAGTVLQLRPRFDRFLARVASLEAGLTSGLPSTPAARRGDRHREYSDGRRRAPQHPGRRRPDARRRADRRVPLGVAGPRNGRPARRPATATLARRTKARPGLEGAIPAPEQAVPGHQRRPL